MENSALLEVRSTRALARSLVREALGLDGAPVLPTPVPLRPRSRWTKWTRGEILCVVLAFQTQHGRWPTSTEFRHGPTLGLPGRSAIEHHYGSREHLLRVARQHVRAARACADGDA